LYTRQTEDGEPLNILPVKKFSVPVDEAAVRKLGFVAPTDKIVPQLLLDMPNKTYLLKNDLALLALIATNEWKRPICFTNTRDLDDLGLSKYCRQEGLTYRLVPVENPAMDHQKAYKQIMSSFLYGGAGNKQVYFDEENRRRLSYLQLDHAQVALALVAAGKKEAARQVLNKFDQRLKSDSFPYGMASSRGNQHDGISLEFLRACIAADDQQLAAKVKASLQKDLEQQFVYYHSIGDDGLTDEQLANEAYALIQGKENNLVPAQVEFAYDILSGFQMLHQIN
jgi:hypothetical protein